MYQFFTRHINSICVGLVLFSLALVNISMIPKESEFKSFSDWVKLHALKGKVEANANAHVHAKNFRFESNDGFLRHMKKVLDDNTTESEAPLDSEIILYLYLTWTKYSNAPDMAGTFSLERAKPGPFVNQGYTQLSGSVGTLNDISKTGFPVQYGSAHTAPVIAYLIAPAISGKSINAP